MIEIAETRRLMEDAARCPYNSAETVVADKAETLKVTTWNVLAPLMGGDKMFPGIGSEIHSQEARRPVLQKQFHNLASDMVMLQEIRRMELRMLMDEGQSPLSQLYESHYVTDRSWRDLEASGGSDETERGVALVWRRGVLSNVSTLNKDLGVLGPPCLGIVRATVTAWAEDVIFATAHLDGDSPVPAVARGQEQLLVMLDAVMELPESQICKAVIVGGDCNFTSYAPVMRKLAARKFSVASGYPDRPTCFSAIASSRFDHLFVRGSAVAEATEIPECPKHSCCPFPSFFHHCQVMFDCLGVTSPKVSVPLLQRCYLSACLVPWLLATVCCLCIPLPLTRQRCRWSLTEWGSDHIPVTVTFRQVRSPTSQNIFRQ
jgi:hypothetical protein